MLKTLRNIAPFIMLGYCFIITILSHYSIYQDYYIYLGDVLGFSIFTDLFMLSVYMNKKYCTATKIAVWSLILLNVLNIFWTYFNVDGFMYDIAIMFITAIIILTYKVFN